MKLQHHAIFLSLLTYNLSTSAQLLANSNGNLPECAQSCSVITDAVAQCDGTNTLSLKSWSCFCQSFWTATGGSVTTACVTSCTSPSDNDEISSWYTANCGSDNGASEHGGISSSSSSRIPLPTTSAETGSATGASANHGNSSPKASGSSNGLSKGAWGGIGVAIAIICLALLALVWFVLRRRRSRLNGQNKGSKPYLDDKAELDTTAAKRRERSHGNNYEIAELEGQGRVGEMDNERGIHELPVEERTQEMRDVGSPMSARS